MSQNRTAKDFRHVKNDTKPRSYKVDKKQFEPKKGGAGGKGTWGKPGDEINPIHYFVGTRDPNYPEEDEGAYFESYEPELTTEELKKQIEEPLLEYFNNGDTDDFIGVVRPLNLGQVKGDLVFLILNISLEKKEDKKELASILLSDLVDSVLFQEDIYSGFALILSQLPDLAIDVPNVAHDIGKFMSRAIMDKALHHGFLTDFKPKSEKGEEAIKHAQVLIAKNNGLDLDTVWGFGGGLRPVKVLSEKIVALLEEYLSSSDVAEAQQCLSDLSVPHFHHELVYNAIYFGGERKQRDVDLILELLKALSNNGLLTSQQLNSGYERIFSNANDISLDIPTFHSFLEEFANKSASDGIISKELATQVPGKGRKRYLSENDGGAVKN